MTCLADEVAEYFDLILTSLLSCVAPRSIVLLQPMEYVCIYVDILKVTKMILSIAIRYGIMYWNSKVISHVGLNVSLDLSLMDSDRPQKMRKRQLDFMKRNMMVICRIFIYMYVCTREWNGSFHGTWI